MAFRKGGYPVGTRVRISFEGKVATTYSSSHYSCHEIIDTNGNTHYVYVDGGGVNVEVLDPPFEAKPGDVFIVAPTVENRHGVSSTWFASTPPDSFSVRFTSANGKVLSLDMFKATYVDNKGRWSVKKANVSA